MAHYDRSSITTLASVAIGFSDAITFLCTIIPGVLFAGLVFTAGEYGNPGEYFEAFGVLFKEAWVVVVPATFVFGGFGYVVTLILRVMGQLLLCLVQIEENTRTPSEA